MECLAQKPYGFYDYEVVRQTLESLRLTNDGDFQEGSAISSQSNNNAASSSSSTAEEFVADNLGENCRQNQTSSFSFGGRIFNQEMDIEMYIDFLKLVEALQGNELNSIVQEVYSRTELFLEAAFCKRGSNSIQKLIKKLKKSNHASNITWILSTRFWDLMIHHTAKEVIEACFVCFHIGPNKILFEYAILYAQDLAIHRVGCKSLQKCIKTISGEQKSRLLDHIAEISYSLSRNEYGNYVVQEVLKLQDFHSTNRILCCLRGHFIELSKDQEASNVVDHCVKLSIHGLLFVVSEIVESPRAPFLLAKDRFGNYVIQKALTALNRAMNPRAIDVLRKLVGSLEPYVEELNQSVGGKNVVNLLEITKKQLESLSKFTIWQSIWSA